MAHTDRGFQLQSLNAAGQAYNPFSANPEGQSDRTNQSVSEFGQSLFEEAIGRASSDRSRAPAPPPDGGWRAWCVVLSTHLVYVNTWGWVNSFGIFQAYYAEHLGLPASKISWISSISVFLLFFVGTLTGRLADAGYFRWVFACGIVFQVTGVMVTSFCTDYWHYFGVQGVLVGLGHSCLFCPVLAVLSTFFARKRALAMGVAACGSATGGVLFPLLARALLRKVGFGWTMRIVGFVQCFLLLISLVLVKPRLRPRRSGPLIDFSAFKDIEYVLYVTASFFTCLGVYLAYYFMAAFSRTAIDPPFTFNQSLDLLMILNGVGVFGRLLANWTADHIGAINVFAPHSFFAGVILFCWMGVTNKPSLYVWSVFYGILAAAIQSLFPIGISLLTEDLTKIGVRMGMAFTIASFASLAGPPAAGAIIDAEHGFTGAQAFAGTAMLLGALFLIAAKKKRMARLGTGWFDKCGVGLGLER
ncbi:major facilitator superfamily domain-containing protein [Fusarium sp. MPI-SDFR-AT-0072]|uniref:Aspyridones efflux protein apdF n=1 Tax=Fusarium oxysporum f. sp. rapae TaxID=485398 RepID=A0A8J5PCE6_FUSOX|nr:Aspyridones efflux protein apdF [Fusarium oxysporum f. sp. rapae]KAH7177993.1 major facilitator superfamily domain-containing protein [Fusarium sp. MPI-SDFR-AT-0072]